MKQQQLNMNTANVLCMNLKGGSDEMIDPNDPPPSGGADVSKKKQRNFLENTHDWLHVMNGKVSLHV